MTRPQVNQGDVMFGLIMMLFVGGCIEDESRGNLEDSSILGIGDSIMEGTLGKVQFLSMWVIFLTCLSTMQRLMVQ